MEQINIFAKVLVKEEITGIILSGGKSSRMGKDKGMCNFRDKPLVEYAIEALKPFCGEILLSTNLTAGYEKYGLKLINDEIKEIGPMGGIYSCLKKVKTKYNIVLSCDTPFIGKELIKFIVNNISDEFDIVAPIHQNSFLEPLCAYYNISVLSKMNAFIKKGDYKLMALLKSLRLKQLVIDNNLGFYNPKLFNNLNTSEDLIRCE